MQLHSDKAEMLSALEPSPALGDVKNLIRDIVMEVNHE